MAAIHKKENTKKEPGFILISVLLMISVLAVFIIEFNYDSRIKFRLADNLNLAAEALNNADAGIAVTMAALRQNKDMLDDETAKPFLSGRIQFPLDDGFCKVSIVKESGKININAICTPEGKPIRRRVDQMLRLIDLVNDEYENSAPIGYSLVPSIIDWLDSDNDVTILPFIKGQNAGAENYYYEKLKEPYRCKNGRFDVLNELLLVKGMTSEIIYERKGGEKGGIKMIPGVSQYLTVYGDGKININEAPIIVVESLSESISASIAQNIIEQRKYCRYSNIEQLKKEPGITNEIYEEIRDLITVDANESFYTVTSTGIVNDLERTVWVVLKKNRSTSHLDIVMRSEINI